MLQFSTTLPAPDGVKKEEGSDDGATGNGLCSGRNGIPS
jgi:hypothetical protein